MINRYSGFSLLEVLVTVLLTTVGILGMVAMQGRAIQYSQDSVERTHAVILANELIEIVRATPTSQNNDSSGSPFFDSLPDSTTNGCLTIDNSDLVSKQVGCWAARVRELLPGADSVSGRFVSCISTTPGTCNSNGAAIEVQLAWNASGEGCLDSEADELDDSLCIYRIRTQI